MSYIIIDKPKSDYRTYVGNTLNNGVKYTVVYDEFLTQTYVAVAINIGSYSNPQDYQGLAHFLEHMLFMGSKKYPNENHFMATINKYGGYTNAYTSLSQTVYYFNLYNSGVACVFDIFSRFFIDPLFDKNCIEREINAVDNEHKNNINNSSVQLFQFILKLTDKTSKLNTFTCGSKETLTFDNIRNELIKFFNMYYTSDNISISVVTSLDINYMVNTINSTFGNIKSSKKVTSEIIKPILKSNLNNYYFLHTFDKIYKLILVWEYPNPILHFSSKDFDILKFVLENTNKYSLFFLLKSKGLIVSINVEMMVEGLFIFEINLTKNGYKHILIIYNTIIDYVNNIIGFTDFNKVAEYLKKLHKLTFDYSNKLESENLCDILASNHFFYNTKSLLLDYNLIKTTKLSIDYKKLYKLYFSNSKKITIVVSNKFLYNISEYNKLEHYNCIYTKLSSQLFENNNLKSITIPSYNFKFKTDFLHPKLLKLDYPNTKPIEYKKNIWFACYTKYDERVTNIFIQLLKYTFFNTPRNYILTELSIKTLNFLIRVFFKDILDSCYDISLNTLNTQFSISLYISGLSDVHLINKIIDKIFVLITNLKYYLRNIENKFYKNLILSYSDKLKNYTNISPSKYSTLVLYTNLFNSEYNYKILLEELKSISVNDIKAYILNVFNNVNYRCFIFGNLTLNNLKKLKLIKILSSRFNTNNVKYDIIKPIKNKIIPHPNSKEKSSAVIYYFELGTINLDSELFVIMYNILFSNLFFSILRTKKQLGYIVNTNNIYIHNTCILYQLVQSNCNIDYIIDNMDDFNNKDIKQHLKKIKFEDIIKTTRDILKTPINNLSEQYDIYLSEIIKKSFNYDKKIQLLKRLDNFTYDKFIKYLNKFINSENKRVHIISGNK